MSAANTVERLYLDPKQDAPALGFSIQVDLGAGRTAVMQTHLANDCSLPELNKMFDKMNAAGDRQRAHYKIEEEVRQVELLEKEQRQHKEDLDRIDKDYEEAQEKRQVEAEKAQGVLDTFMDAAREAHATSGRRGEFALRGAEKSQFNGVAANVAKLKEELAKAKAEHDVTHAKWVELSKRRNELIEKHQREIARCREIEARGLIAND